MAPGSGTTLRELVVAGLRAEVERCGAAVVVDFHFPTAAGEWVVTELALEDVVHRSYGLPS